MNMHHEEDDAPSVVSFEDFLEDQHFSSSNKKNSADPKAKHKLKNMKNTGFHDQAKPEEIEKNCFIDSLDGFHEEKLSQVNLTSSDERGCNHSNGRKPEHGNLCRGKKRKIKNVKKSGKTLQSVKRKRSSSDEIIITSVTAPMTLNKSKIKKHKSSHRHESQDNKYIEDDANYAELLWCDKYQPQTSSDLLNNKDKAGNILAWLKQWKERVDKDKLRLLQIASCNERKKARNDDDFRVTDEDMYDDDISICNTSVLIGPVGSGKTTAVYTCARQAGFKVLELNASTLRSNRCVLSQIQEATQSHLVSKTAADGTQNKVSGVRKQNRSNWLTSFTKCANTSKIRSQHEGNMKECRRDMNGISKSYSDETSLILFDEVEAVLEDDKGFWLAVQSLMETSKRPIILTTSNESVCKHLERNYEKICFKSPSKVQLCNYLRNIAHKERCEIDYDGCEHLVCLKDDIRHSIMSLQFWAEWFNCANKPVISDQLNSTLKYFYLKLSGILGYIHGSQHSFPQLMLKLHTLDDEMLSNVESAISHLSRHHLPRYCHLNDFESLYFRHVKSPHNHEDSLKIHTTIPACDFSNFMDSDDNVDLLSLAYNRTQRPLHTLCFDDKLASRVERGTIDCQILPISNRQPLISSLQMTKSEHGPNSTRFLNNLSDYFEMSSQCDLLQSAYSHIFELDNQSTSLIVSDGNLDETGIVDEASFHVESVYNDVRAALQVRSLRKLQNELSDIRLHEILPRFCCNLTKTHKIYTSLFHKLHEYGGVPSCRTYYTDMLPTLRCICRSELQREKAKTSRRFLHYMSNIGVHLTSKHLYNLATEFEYASTS